MYSAGGVVSAKAFGRPLIEPVHAFPDGLVYIPACFSLGQEKLSSPRPMAEYHLSKKKRMVMKAQVVSFTNGCPK
jgi:hypothetical protein